MFLWFRFVSNFWFGPTLGCSWTVRRFVDFDLRLEIEYDHHEGILCEASIMMILTSYKCTYYVHRISWGVPWRSLRFLFPLATSAISKSLGSFDLHVWSALSPYDLICLDPRDMFVDLCILIMILGFVVELPTVRCYQLNCILFAFMLMFIWRGTHMSYYLYVSPFHYDLFE